MKKYLLVCCLTAVVTVLVTTSLLKNRPITNNFNQRKTTVVESPKVKAQATTEGLSVSGVNLTFKE